MIHAKDLPLKIPVFPLPGALLLPRSRLPLHIFEPRYLSMVEDVLKTSHRLIGMVQPLGGPNSQNKLHRIGCAGRITSFTETEDNRYMVTLTGVSRFRILDEVDGFTPYRNCDVDWTSFTQDHKGAEHDTAFDRDAFMPLLKRYFKDRELDTDWDSLGAAEDELLINSLSMLCPFRPEDKQALLETPSLKLRREILVTLIEFAMRGGSGEGTMQ